MRLLLNATDLIVGDEVVGQGRIVSIVRDAHEVTAVGSGFRFTTDPEHAIWVERMVQGATA